MKIESGKSKPHPSNRQRSAMAVRKFAFARNAMLSLLVRVAVPGRWCSRLACEVFGNQRKSKQGQNTVSGARPQAARRKLAEVFAAPRRLPEKMFSAATLSPGLREEVAPAEVVKLKGSRAQFCFPSKEFEQEQSGQTPPKKEGLLARSAMVEKHWRRRPSNPSLQRGRACRCRTRYACNPCKLLESNVGALQVGNAPVRRSDTQSQACSDDQETTHLKREGSHH